MNRVASAESIPPPLLPLLHRIEVIHALLCAGAALLALALGGVSVTNGVLLGGALLSGNVWILKRLFGFLISRGSHGRRLAIALLFAKLPVLWALFWLIAKARLIPLDGMGLAVGISCFPVAVVVVTLAWHARPGSERAHRAR